MNFNIKHFSIRFRYVFPLFLKLFLALFMALLVFLSVSLVGVRLLGVEIYTMLSSSMEPSYRLGSVIYVKETEISELQIGDVITFRVEDDITVSSDCLPMLMNLPIFVFRPKEMPMTFRMVSLLKPSALWEKQYSPFPISVSFPILFAPNSVLGFALLLFC